MNISKLVKLNLTGCFAQNHSFAYGTGYGKHLDSKAVYDRSGKVALLVVWVLLRPNLLRELQYRFALSKDLDTLSWRTVDGTLIASADLVLANRADGSPMAGLRERPPLRA